jgi:uncharacterized damage-inducible protein DinB
MKTSEPGTDMTSQFLNFSRALLLDECWPRLRSCVESLSEEQLWWRPNEASNSVGNLLLHLDGNVRQWIVTSFSGAKDQRNRPAEFAVKGAVTKNELIERLGKTLQEAAAVLARLTEAELTAPRNIQNHTITGMGAVYHVVEHFAMHYGQVLYITKLLKAENLGFYRELDKTERLP